jgi:hypothetical protein
MEKPERVWIDNLGDKVNSKFPEYAPFISADESVLIFTGRRDDTQGAGIDENDGKFLKTLTSAEGMPKVNGKNR